MPGGVPKIVWGISMGCLNGVWDVEMYLKVKSGLVKSVLVKSGDVKSGQVKSG